MKISIFVVTKQQILNPMPRTESTNIFSEISTFFCKKENDKAIMTIMDIAKNLKLSAKTLDLESRCTCKYKRLQVFELLLLFPLFMVKNAFRYTDSTLAKVVPCKKDVFYRFMENGAIDWRMILYRINRQLLNKLIVRSDSANSSDPVCLIIDDTDLPKTGTKIEKMGRIFSHVTHSSLLGFKALFLCRTDGKTQTVLDFSLHGEEGRRPDRPYGMTKKQIERQYSKVRNQNQAVTNRMGEYTQSKIQKAIDMVRHALSQGVRFDYLLADSWFTCTDMVKFIKSRHSCCHYLGMVKMAKPNICLRGNCSAPRNLLSCFQAGRPSNTAAVCTVITRLQMLNLPVFG